MPNIVFIYAKKGKIKVLNYEDSKELGAILMADGWKHTSTLNACTFIEYLHNTCECENIMCEILSLSKVKL